MSKIQKAVDWAISIANNPACGYSQADRWGPNYDCSSFVIQAYQQAGVPVKSNGASYTGNMRGVFLRCGFSDVTASVDMYTGHGLQKGDVLLNVANHTCMAIGNGQVVNARGANGHPESGDQSDEIRVQSYYNYPWDCVLRYSESVAAAPEPEEPEEPNTYTVKSGDTLWGIAEKHLGAGYKYADIMRWNGLKSQNIYPGQTLSLVKQDVPVAENEPISDDMYTVKSGDTLWGIAVQKYGNGLKYKDIKAANGLKSDAIYVGQKIKLP